MWRRIVYKSSLSTGQNQGCPPKQSKSYVKIVFAMLPLRARRWETSCPHSDQCWLELQFCSNRVSPRCKAQWTTLIKRGTLTVSMHAVPLWIRCSACFWLRNELSSLWMLDCIVDVCVVRSGLFDGRGQPLMSQNVYFSIRFLLLILVAIGRSQPPLHHRHQWSIVCKCVLNVWSVYLQPPQLGRPSNEEVLCIYAH